MNFPRPMSEKYCVVLYVDQMKASVLYMIPSPVWPDNVESIPSETIRILHSLDHFIVERAKTARRYIKASGHPMPLQQIEIIEMDGAQSEITVLQQWISSGLSIGVISEAGCPGVADPGTTLVAEAHRLKISVVPCVGPSSVLMALMASGFNGQQFSFNGYLPNKKPELTVRLKNLEQIVLKERRTQIFIETPYRNHFLLEECLRTLHEDTVLSLACGLNGPDPYIKTMKIRDWRKLKNIFLHKVPCVFSIGTL
jgi:16S rRNA (cytidine1402-2'-O)-methyltransferase